MFTKAKVCRTGSLSIGTIISLNAFSWKKIRCKTKAANIHIFILLKCQEMFLEILGNSREFLAPCQQPGKIHDRKFSEIFKNSQKFSLLVLGPTPSGVLIRPLNTEPSLFPRGFCWPSQRPRDSFNCVRKKMIRAL